MKNIFLLTCSTYNDLRNSLETIVNENCPNFKELSTDMRFIYLLNAEGKIIRAVGKFIHDAFIKRAEILKC